MHALRVVVSAIALTFWLTGCAHLEDSVNKFDQGTHAASAAEMDFLRSALTLKCAADYYSSAAKYAATAGNGAAPDYKMRCSAKRVNELHLRQLAMDSLVAYADKMLALASSGDRTTLDATTQKMAASVNAAAKTEQFSGIPTASIVEAGIIALTDVALDRTKNRDMQQAASSVQPGLASIIADLKSENDTALKDIPTNSMTIYLAIDNAIMTTNRRPTALDFAAAAYILDSAGIPDSSMTSLAVEPSERVEKLNATLDAVLAANKALATGTPESIKDAIKDLSERVQAARSMRNTLNN